MLKLRTPLHVAAPDGRIADASMRLLFNLSAIVKGGLVAMASFRCRRRQVLLRDWAILLT